MGKAMNSVAVTTGDILTPLGDLQSTWDAMCACRTGLVSTQRSCISNIYATGYMDTLPGQGGSWVRMQGLLDGLLSTMAAVPGDAKLFLATTKGAVDELSVTGDPEAGQAWQLADFLKNELGLTGPATTVSAACASGTLAVVQAALQILQKQCTCALVVGVDLVADFILTGFDSLKGLSPGGAKPFDRHRDGLSLGDGGGWLLLRDSSGLESSSILGLVDGWGVSCDATHITAPCPRGSGLKRAFSQLMAMSDSRIGGINAHGTGTVYNDAMELLVFKELCRPATPVCSGKGAIGHSLGASGVIEAVLSLKSLRERVLPPTVGLEEVEETEMVLSGNEQLRLLYPSIVSCNSGFGGINAALRFAAP